MKSCEKNFKEFLMKNIHRKRQDFNRRLVWQKMCQSERLIKNNN